MAFFQSILSAVRGCFASLKWDESQKYKDNDYNFPSARRAGQYPGGKKMPLS